METIYARLLGDTIDDLPDQVREFHLNTAQSTWSGVCEVRHGWGILPRIARAILGLPAAGTGVAVSVTVARLDGAEIWTRTFAKTVLRTRQTLGRSGTLREHFGPLRVEMDLVLRGQRLYLEPRRWAFLIIPLPRRLMPGGSSYESQSGRYFYFDVEYRMPIIGLIAAYRGTLLPDKG